MSNVQRLKLSPKAKELFKQFCQSTEIHGELNVTYQEVANRIISWLYRQPIDIWNEVIKILDNEILSSKEKCFTGKLSRLVSVLDGFHPGVRVAIATSDQISNRVLKVMERSKNENISNEETLLLIKEELEDLGMPEKEINVWLDTVKETFDD